MNYDIARTRRYQWNACLLLALALVAAELAGQDTPTAETVLSPAAKKALQEFKGVSQEIHVEQIQTAVQPPPVAPASAAEAAVPEAGAAPPALDRARRVILTDEAARTSEAIVRAKVIQANPTLGSNVVILPGAIQAPTASGESVEIRHVAMPGRRLEYDANTEEFTGTLEVGVVAFGGDTGTGLKVPVTFQVLEAGSEPSSTVIVSGLAPPFTSIPIKVKNPRPPVKLRIASGSDQPTEEVSLSVAPTLFVWPASSVLVGEGLGETELLIVAVAEDGGRGQIVQLTAEPAARFSSANVMLDDNGVATTRIRSVGTGAVIVRARAPGFTTAPTRLTYESVARKLSISTDSDEIQGYGVGATMLTIVAT
ncbi:MAG TPA: hypothetical protein VJ809_08835, partial [Pirellulales bacterium]|nr:hypothetical protein [Pirellulales bacterium]